MPHQRRLNFDDLSPKERQRRERVDRFYQRYRKAKSETGGNYFDEAAHREAERRAKAAG